MKHIVTEFKAKKSIREINREMPLWRYKKATGVKARGYFILSWSERQDLNLRPLGPEPVQAMFSEFLAVAISASKP